MKIDIVTIFPEIAEAPLSSSIVGRAMESGSVDIQCHNLRDWTTDKHHKVDDIPYGGGPGMVMKPEPFFAAVNELRTEKTKVLLMTPQGRPMRQATAERFAQESHLSLIHI